MVRVEIKSEELIALLDRVLEEQDLGSRTAAANWILERHNDGGSPAPAAPAPPPPSRPPPQPPSDKLVKGREIYRQLIGPGGFLCSKDRDHVRGKLKVVFG